MHKSGIHRFSRLWLIALGSWLMASLFSSCENDKKDIDDWTRQVTRTEEAVNIESMLSQQGKLKARLKAPLMRRVFADTVYAEFPKSLHCDFYNDQNQVESWLDCKYGKYYENHGKVYLRDSVVVITAKGDTLRSPDLWWDQNTKLFYTDKVAYYFTRDKQISASRGLEATQDFSRVTFNNLLYSTMTVSETGLPK